MFDPFASLGLSVTEQLERARTDLRMGLPCLLLDRAQSGVMVALETVSPQRFNALRDMLGEPELVLTAHRVRAISTDAVAAGVQGQILRVRPPEQADLDWFRSLSDPDLDDLNTPIGPLHILRDAVPSLHSVAIDLVKSAELLPAAAVFPVLQEGDLQRVKAVLSALDVDEMAATLAAGAAMMPVSAAFLPLESHENSKLHVFRDPEGGQEHYAIEIGAPDRNKPVLSRLHSACFTGDVLGSLKCDCGPQLRAALEQMGAEGAGVLLYLNQEGRGIGLANKMRVYALQSKGLDTVEANHRLGYEDDERDFRTAAWMLRELGFDAVRLLTNNPAKVESFQNSGINIVERLPLRVGKNLHNQHYLSVKALKSGHQL